MANFVIRLIAVFTVVVVSQGQCHDIFEKRAAEKCFDDLGCFSIDKDFFHPIYRPVNLLPQDRDIINVRYNIYTPNSGDEFILLRAVDIQSTNLTDLGLNAKVNTKFIVHGWLDNHKKGQWMINMKSEFMKHGDFNVVIVDWSGGNLPPYTQATSNTRVVGAEIAFFVQKLQESIGLNPREVHLLGHSLGGQIVGYAGERIDKLGRITSLDPAQPYYQNMPPSVRIDPTDAEFVEVVHTDSDSIVVLGLGMSQLAGHVDFFPNNGVKQPGCVADRKMTDIDEIYKGNRLLCSHVRALHFVHESINNQCQMVGHACHDWKTFLAGQCASCGAKGDQCAILGMKSDSYAEFKNDSRPMKFYLKTNKEPPYCLFHYQVTIHLTSKGGNDQRGKLYLTIHGDQGNQELPLGDGSVSLHHGTQYTFLATTRTFFGEIKSVTFRWKTSRLSIIFTHKLSLQKILVVPMNDVRASEIEKNVREFCVPKGIVINSGKSVKLTEDNKC